MTPGIGAAAAGLALLTLALAPAAVAQTVPADRFPALTGRVVDQAQILSPATEANLASRLQALESQTGRQLVVATIASLEDYPIEDYGYQLGRHWGVGRAGEDDGALFLVAPNDRQVRIEVGYGLEPVLTDALSSTILQTAVLPRFREGDMEGGVVAGTEAIAEQLSLDPDAAQARVAAAAEQAQPDDGPGILTVLVILFILLTVFGPAFGGRRGGLLPWIILGALSGGGGGRGGGWSGGGGFSGGGGSFGGGGASGRW